MVLQDWLAGRHGPGGQKAGTWDAVRRKGQESPWGAATFPPKGALGGFQPGVIVSSLHILSDGIGLDQLS